MARAHSSAEADFLDVKAHVRYGCAVTSITGDGDNKTYEVTTTLESFALRDDLPCLVHKPTKEASFRETKTR